jgi:hypothetical protein
MAYDEGLAQRVEDALGEMDGLVGKKMFGGVGYLLNGNMAVGVLGDELIVRTGPERYEELLGRPHVGEFGPTGRTMTGWVTVGPEGLSEDADLSAWIEIGVAFAASLPPK